MTKYGARMILKQAGRDQTVTSLLTDDAAEASKVQQANARSDMVCPQVTLVQ